jgi:hypothetical protein
MANLRESHRFAVPVIHSGAPNVQRLRKSRYRIVDIPDPTRRFICARRTRRRTRGFCGNGNIFATRWFGGGGKCADQRYSARSCERWWNIQFYGRSQRHRQCWQDRNAATAAHSRPDAAGWFAHAGRTCADDHRTASDGGGIRGTQPAARQSSPVGGKPDESERSREGVRQHAEHLPRLLNIRSAILRQSQAQAGKREAASLTAEAAVPNPGPAV